MRLLLCYLLSCLAAFAQYGASKDRVYTTLDDDIAATDTVITLVDGSAFPDDDYYVVICPSGECQLGATAANGETIAICGKASTHVLDICATGREVQADGTGTSTGDGGNPTHAVGEAAVLTIVAPQWNLLTDAFVTLDAATSGTNTGDQTTVSGNAGTATALAANGANCSTGFTAGGVDASGVAEACLDQTRKFTLQFETPVTGDSGKFQVESPCAATLLEVAGNVVAATSVTIDLFERARATPGTGTTGMLTTPLVLDTDGAVTTSFTDAALAADVPMALGVTAVSGTPGLVRVHIKYRCN